jgi:hypothetical protein
VPASHDQLDVTERTQIIERVCVETEEISGFARGEWPERHRLEHSLPR